MNLSEIHRVYFIGIGGIGMSALARYFKANGKEVAGYDKTPTEITDSLMSIGIDVHFKDDEILIPANFSNTSGTLVVYTPAVPKDHKELEYFISNGYIVKKRAEVFGYYNSWHLLFGCGWYSRKDYDIKYFGTYTC